MTKYIDQYNAIIAHYSLPIPKMYTTKYLPDTSGKATIQAMMRLTLALETKRMNEETEHRKELLEVVNEVMTKNQVTEDDV